LFFVHFAKIHPKHKSPYVSIVFQIIVLSVLVYIGSGSYETLLHLLIPLIILLYSAVLLSVVILRYKKPDMPRPFKAPFGKFGPFVTVAFMAFLMYMYLKETHGAIELIKISMSLIAFGIPAYFAIEIFYEQRYINMRRNLRAYLRHNYHKIPLPRPTFNRIHRLIGDTHKDTVILDYDCGVGGFTRSLIRRGMPFKKIYAVDKAHFQVRVFKKNLPEAFKRRVTIYERESWRLPKRIDGVDVFVSFNSLGYMDDIPAFLKHMKSVLNRKGRFCFYIKNTFINMTPNALDVEDKKKIVSLFAAQGLEAEYHTRKRLFSEEIYINGRKK
ncbi:amino acid permease, partial [Candidatus Woesearchaeota archaeon]|nr:amino acid permease [Candidatus Woesearchaeota archaeon]